ncbi:LON peptidase N-terminal domain and RING finger protein 1 [Anguilla rostrata]|uniref:LON peptidase N-terminal domain and RING finger protein 1 n=1 Tax=Anguilla rostrata TaxID=7938 RepID=UPI0030D07B97
MDFMDCPICEFLMCEPVTVPCGHSFCRRCVGTSLSARCPICKEKLKSRDVKNIKNNVLLFSVIEKCCPEEVKLKCRLRERLKAREFAQALRIVDEGLDIYPEDVSLKLWRAEVFVGLQRFADALRDLSDLCRQRPSWAEGFFRKGRVLQDMGRHTEALCQYQHCLRLHPEFSTARSEVTKILAAEGVAVPEDSPQLLPLVSEYLRDPRPVVSAVAPSHGDGSKRSADQEGDAGRLDDAVQGVDEAKHGTSTECCLSLCQAVSFLPSAEEDEELMMRKEERGMRGRGGQRKEISLSVLTVSDFECPLCIRQFYEPVSTPCGHTFCKSCIERSLDHNLHCPLCKQPLHEYLRNRKYIVTVLLQEVMSQLFPQQLEERTQVHEAEIAELSNLTQDIPIFVCTVAFPGVACPLHIFEPRYRLMMRRCVETGTRKFGMCTYEPGKGFADYGCMLDILRLDLLPDGRSFVDTVGGSRFRVLRRSQRDGYHTADIEYLEDQKVEGAELDLLKRLHDNVYEQAREWYRRLNGRIQDQVSRQYGPMPQMEDDIQASPDGPVWCWWLLSVLQLDPSYQTTILSLPSLKDRLGHLRLVLEYFSQG